MICSVSDRRRTGSFLCAATRLVWVAFVEQALEIFLVASAYVRVRLPKSNRRRTVVVAVN
jgi:hypothetical protein